MPSTKKIERVAELKRQIEGSAALLLTEYRGLTVSEITELRKSLRDGGARFAVIKNTLMRRAIEKTDAAGLGPLFEGPSAVAFVIDDPVAAAKFQAAQSRFLSLLDAFRAKLPDEPAAEEQAAEERAAEEPAGSAATVE